MFAAEFNLTAAVLDIGSVVLGEELDLGRAALQPIMLFKGGEKDLADEAGHLAFLRRLHRQDDADQLPRGRMVHVERARPPRRRHFSISYLIIGESRRTA